MEELRKFDKVRVVLSGYHYPKSLIDMCKQAKPPIYALRTSGDGHGDGHTLQ